MAFKCRIMTGRKLRSDEVRSILLLTREIKMDISPVRTNPNREENTSEQPVASSLSEIDQQWLDNHLECIRKLITQEAIHAAKDKGADLPPAGLEVAEAARRFAPGVRFPDEPSFSDRIKSSLSGITLVSALLAVVFGVLGVWQSHRGPADAPYAAAYFDIVKLFAGAVVGSTGAGAVIGARRK
jgi:hypothetical protein